MKTSLVMLLRTTVLALAVGMCAHQNAHAATLRDAATVNSTNASQVRFDQVYRITPHNTYNPNSWHSLTQALNEGVRTIELDVYNSIGGPSTPALCATYGGTWRTVPPATWVGCDGSNSTRLSDALRKSLRQAIDGQPVTDDPLHSVVGLQVKHDPLGEDPYIYDFLTFAGGHAAGLTGYVTITAALIVASATDDFYGNNCSGGDVTTVGNMKTELARCLQTIRAWMAAHPGHTPITLLFDIKENMPREAALAFDLTLRAVFGDKLYTPKQLQGGYESPRARVADIGWPPLSGIDPLTGIDLSGKVLAIYTRGETFQFRGHTEPNDTLRYYLNGIADAGFDPAAFVCPLVNSGPDVDAPYSFGRGPRITPADYPRLMGQVVCNNIYIGQDTGWVLDTAAVPMQDALAAVDAARTRHLLTYVWSFDDPLAHFPEVAHEFVRRGVNMFSIERGGLSARVPHPYTQKILPWEGLSGITNYGFILRQKNNPYYVLEAHEDGRITQGIYTGAKSQQWALSRTGRLYSLGDKSKCVTIVGTHSGHAFGRPHSLDSEDDNWRRRAGLASEPHIPPADMRPCGADAIQSFTLKEGFLPPHGQVTGVRLQLNPNKIDAYWFEFFLTPSTYNDRASLIAGTVDHEAHNCGISSPTQRKGPVGTYGVTTPAYVVPPDNVSTCVPRQIFEIDFHTSAAEIVDDSLGTQPPKSAILVPDEAPGSHTPPPSWRDYPFIDANYDAIRNNQYMPQLEINLWTFGWVTNYLYPGAIANGTLPFYAVRTGVIDDPSSGGTVPNPAASEFLSAGEYAKWQSSARTLVSDFPADPALDALAREMLSNFRFFGCSQTSPIKYCNWLKLPKTPHPQPYQYWEIPNKAYLWYLAQSVLPPAEYLKWQQRLKFTGWSDLYVDWEVLYVAGQLLEHGTNAALIGGSLQFTDGLGTLYYDKLEIYMANQKACHSGEDGPPEDVCAGRISPASDHRYHWNLIPFDADHRVMAEAAFNSPRPEPYYASRKQPEDWALWSAAAAIKEAAGGRKVSYKDVPLGGNYHTIVTGSKLLDEVEKAKYLEKERLENQFVAQNKTITHLDVDPDELKREVATQYLSAAELALWNERAAVALKDVPLNSTLLTNGKAAKLLSARELADFTAQVQAAGHVDAPLPKIWPDVPPARGKRFVAKYLLPASEYPKWVEAEAGTELDFPQVYTNWVVDDIAAKTLSADEFSAWKRIVGANPPQATYHKWLMMPHRPSAHWISIRLLPNAEATKWQEMINLTMLPQHLGGSPGAIIYAKSALSAADFQTWQTYASQQNMPLTWQAFRHDKSLMQQRIVEAIFGAGSPDHHAWMQDAGLE